MQAENPAGPAFTLDGEVTRAGRGNAFDGYFDDDFRPAFLAIAQVDTATHVVEQSLADGQPETAAIFLA